MQYPGFIEHNSSQIPDNLIKYLAIFLYIDNPFPELHLS